MPSPKPPVFALRWIAGLHADSPRYTPLAVFLIVAMIPVLGAMSLDPREFQGINVWIKPFKFLLALALYLLTLAWMARFADAKVTSRPWWRWHERAVVVAIVAEMLWIGGAAAHGVGSHFNVATPAMGMAYAAMGVAAVVLTSASSTLAFAIGRDSGSRLSPAIKSGLVWGLALTLPLTLVTAGTLSAGGSHWIGGTPSDAGGLPWMGWSRDGGDLRVSHFFATHALHAVPLMALLIARGFGPTAVVPVRVAALAYGLFVFGTYAQALMGEPFLPRLG